MRPKHTPIRTCVACRTSGDKRGLLRVVRTPESVVRFDPTGKANGRGAYVCASEKCIALARKQRKFERSLTPRGGPAVTVPPELETELMARARPECEAQM